MNPQNPIHAVLDALASPQQQDEASFIVRLKPEQIEEAMNALRDHRTLFSPVITGQTDTEPIYVTYERMRQADMTQPVILLLVECQTTEEFRETLIRMPIRKSSEWRSRDHPEYWDRYFGETDDTKVL